MTANDFSRHAFPPQGWMFRQPQLNWENPMKLVGFDASVDAIRKVRLANPAVTAKNNLSTDPVAIGNELETYTRARLGIPVVPPSFFQPSSSRLPSRVLAAAADIKRAAQGTAVPLDWLRSGGDPVNQELAEKRAVICVNCSKNVEGPWYVTAPAKVFATALTAWQAIKHSNFEFKTEQGEKLKSCDVCHCLMRFKVFTPLEHILMNTKPEVMAEFPSNCWIARKDA